MEDEAAQDFLDLLAREAKRLSPRLNTQRKKFDELLLASRETKPTGGATDKARQALQKLRNPLLSSTHLTEARAVKALAVRDTGHEFAKALEKAIVAWALHTQAKTELELHQSSAETEWASREGDSLAGPPRGSRFLQALKDRGVSPSAPDRLREFQHDLIAALVGDAEGDLSSRENWWNILCAHGVLEAFGGALSEDEARMLAAAKQVRVHPDVLEFQKRLEHHMGRELDVTPAFAAVCWAISENSRELTTKDEQAIRAAERQTRERETDTLMRLLDRDPAEYEEIARFVDFIHGAWRVAGDADDRIRIERILDTMETTILSYERRSVSPVYWLERLRTDLLHDQGLVANTLSEGSSFYTLLVIALERSGSFTKLRDDLLEEGKRRMAAEAAATIESFRQNNWDCYLDADGRPHLGLPEEGEHGCTLFPAEPEEDLQTLIQKGREQELELYDAIDRAARCEWGDEQMSPRQIEEHPDEPSSVEVVPDEPKFESQFVEFAASEAEEPSWDETLDDFPVQSRFEGLD